MNLRNLLTRTGDWPHSFAPIHAWLTGREVDGTPQFCRVYPTGYEPKWVGAATYGLTAESPYIRWWAADSRHSGLAAEYANQQAVIYMEPHGRGNTTYLGIGDNDVMKVIAAVRGAGVQRLGMVTEPETGS
jgi:hypothetical protein